MLTLATIGMAAYGLYAVLYGLVDLVSVGALEWWANVWSIGAGIALIFAAPFVRASMPGGLALGVGGLLGLQSLSLHNASHLYGQVVLEPQLARAAFALLLVGLAYFGWGADEDTLDPATSPPPET